LSIQAENCSLRDILEAVHKQTGATIESASIATGVRFAAYIRQGNPAHVLADLLYSSGLNYIIVGSGSVAVERIILMPRSTAPEQIAIAKLAPVPKVDTSALAVTPAAALPAVSITEATDKDPSAMQGTKGEQQDDKAQQQDNKAQQQDDKAQLATSSAKPGGNDSTSDAGQTPARAENAAKVPEEKPAPSLPPDQEASSSLPPLPGGAASEALMRNLFPSLFAQSQSGGSTTATSGSGLTQNPFASSNSNSGGSNSINQTTSSNNSTPATQLPSSPLQIQIGRDGNPVIPGVPPEWVPQLCEMTGMTCAQLINSVKNPPPPPPPPVTCQLNQRTQVASCH
jgi:hypothetical protein